MKKIVFIVFALFAFSVRADNVITSKSYVDTAANNLQNQIGANNANTVLTYTGSAGTVGEKAIYDSSAAYGGQQDALVTAGAFNTAVQNALDTEFVCIERQAGTGGCLLYQIHSAAQKQTLPAGYTQLEYISFDGTRSTGAYINTGLDFYTDIPNTDIKFEADVKMYQGSDWQVIVGAVGSSTAYIGTNDGNYFYYGYGISDTTTNVLNPYTRCFHRFDAPNGTYNINDFVNDSQIVTATFSAYNRTKQLPIIIGGYHRSASQPTVYRAKMDLYSIKIYNDSVLAFNGIPCKRDSDGVVGLYDTVSDTFKTNAEGTNALVAGPVFSYLPQTN